MPAYAPLKGRNVAGQLGLAARRRFLAHIRLDEAAPERRHEHEAVEAGHPPMVGPRSPVLHLSQTAVACRHAINDTADDSTMT
jgi:hypothetical protein